MLGNELKIKREKELVEKGKFYNPFQHENEREIRNRRKVEASKEEKTLNRQFLNSMKDDINFNDQKRNEEKRNSIKEGEHMIQLDKSFVEERRKKRKELMDRYQMEAKRDYEVYLKKKDLSRFVNTKNPEIDKEAVTLKLKPDERFFKYQKNFFMNSITALPQKLETELSYNKPEESRYHLSPSPKKSKMFNNDGYSMNSRENIITHKSQITENRMNSVADLSKSERNIFVNNTYENSVKRLKKDPKLELLEKNLIERTDSYLLLKKHQKFEEESNKMLLNPYSLKGYDIGKTKIKDNPLLFDIPSSPHKQFNARSSLKNTANQVLMNN